MNLHEYEQELQIVKDYVHDLDDAIASGDLDRARTARATAAQALHILGLVLDPAGLYSPALVHDNGRYVNRPASLAGKGES